jgi:hypothetical protein
MLSRYLGLTVLVLGSLWGHDGTASGQTPANPLRQARVDFSRHLRPWDGFGVNYVEAAQTRDYKAAPQEYGGLSTLSEDDRRRVLDLVFGPDGLRPGLLKMFLDCWHQPEPDPAYNRDPNVITPSAYDHETTTRWMRYFAREGLARTRAQGGNLTVITTLYGPPAWMTRQRFVRGRDLDPEMKAECAKYIIAWAKYLRDEEHLPVAYVSLHNEGEAKGRWPKDGSDAGGRSHDYNLYWPPEQVVDFLRFMRPMMDRQGLKDVGLACGETSTWTLFSGSGYARAIADDPPALANLCLITSHGFGKGSRDGIDLLRATRPELHAWTTSMSWGKMDVAFIENVRAQVYEVGGNAVIPWATVQCSGRWVGGDPNPGTAIRVDGKGGFAVERGYYFFKQVSRAGQPGMAVAPIESKDPEVGLIAFASAGTTHPDVLVVLNLSEKPKELRIEVAGTRSRALAARRTGPGESYANAGDFELQGGTLEYRAPGGSVTTFFGKP